MAVIKCKMCGGDLSLVEGQSVAQCEYCGSRQTVPSADSEKKLNLFASANKLRAACEFDRAAGIYDAIKAEFPSEAESYWGLVLCKYGIEYVDDPATGKKIPTCHRLSYDSVMDDANLELAMDYADAVARKVYREEAKLLEKIRTGILEVSSNEKPYDIFLCYKETDENGERTLDSVMAQDIYSALTDKGYRVFFSRITLQSMLGEAYEPYIFAALNSAKVMLAIGTDPEYYSAVWVKNEWSRYLKICAADKSKHLIPCYKDMDAYDMPKEFRPLQGVDLGKMGAVQDILFNMEKYIPRTKQNTNVIQKNVVVGNAGGNNKIAALLDRGNMALEDGDWAKADSFFEDVLNNDSKNAQAYLGKTLAQERCRTVDALVRKRKDVYLIVQPEKLYIQERKAHIGEMAERYSLPGYVEQGTIRDLYRFDLGYTSEVSGREKQYREEESWWQNHRWLSRAEKFAFGAVAETIQNEKKHLFAQLNDRVKKAQEVDARSVAKLEAAYDAHIAQADARAEKLYNHRLSRREKNYQDLLEQATAEINPATLNKLAKSFDELGDYKDSKQLAQHCRKRAADEQEKIDAAEKRQQQLQAQQEQERKAKIKNVRILTAIVTVVSIVLMILVTKVIIPGNQYKKAEELLAAGDTYGAAKTFGAAGGYQDSRNRSLNLWDTIAQRATIAAGANHTVALLEDGSVVAVGLNDDGQCGVSYWTDVVAIAAGDYHTVGLRSDGTVIAVGDNTYGQCDVSAWHDIVDIAAGECHTVGLQMDGTVVTVGYNNHGQCDLSDWTDIANIAAANYCTVGLRMDGTVIAAGGNKSIVNGVSDWTDITAITTSGGYTAGLRADGTVVAAGSMGDGERDVSDWENIVSIAARGLHTVGVQLNGTVVAVGDNDDGQCDVSSWTNIVVIAAGDNHTVGLKADGTVVAVGRNRYGQCDISGWSNIKLPAGSEERKAAMDAAEAEMLAAEYAAAEALEAEGLGAQAALAFYALGDYQDARERSLKLWNAFGVRETISAGGYSTMCLKADGTVLAVGNNEYGQCDVSDWKDIVSVSSGGYHSVGLKSDGTVVAQGLNEHGQCNVSGWSNIVAISAAWNHTVGLKADGTVVVVGDNLFNQCDVSDWTDIVAISAGTNITVGLKADGTVVAVGDNHDNQCNVSGWTDIVAISAGSMHTVGLKADGTVECAGGWEKIISGWTDIVSISSGGSHVAGLKTDGTVEIMGDNYFGQCDTSDWTDIVSVSAGYYYTLGVKADGTLVAVGENKYGQCDVSDWKFFMLP